MVFFLNCFCLNLLSIIVFVDSHEVMQRLDLMYISHFFCVYLDVRVYVCKRVLSQTRKNECEREREEKESETDELRWLMVRKEKVGY